MARQHELDRGRPQGLDHVEVLLAGHPEDPVDALVLERRHQQVRTFVILSSFDERTPSRSCPSLLERPLAGLAKDGMSTSASRTKDTMSIVALIGRVTRMVGIALREQEARRRTPPSSDQRMNPSSMGAGSQSSFLKT